MSLAEEILYIFLTCNVHSEASIKFSNLFNFCLWLICYIFNHNGVRIQLYYRSITLNLFSPVTKHLNCRDAIIIRGMPKSYNSDTYKALDFSELFYYNQILDKL